jgi:hypothetical protein
MATQILPFQILNDGYRNTTLKISGYVNAADITNYTVLDPSTLSQIDAQGTLAKTVRVKRINFDIQDGLQVDLIWDGATPTSLWECTGRGEIKAGPFGGITDNATTPNGKILLTTIGGATTTLNTSFTIILEIIKS